MSLPVPEFERSKTVGLFTIIFYVLLIAAGLWLVYELRDLIPPFLIAIIIALTLSPEIDRMERRGWKRGGAILVIYALFIAVFASFLVIMIPFISGQLGQVSRDLSSSASIPTTSPFAKHNIFATGAPASASGGGSIPSNTKPVTASPSASPSAANPSPPASGVPAQAVQGPLTGITNWVKMHIPSVAQGPVLDRVSKIPTYLSNYLDYLSVELPLLAGQLVWIIIVPILAFYILADYHKILGKTLIFVHADKRAATMRILNDVVAVFGNYVRGVLLMMLLDIVVTYCVLRASHVPFAETIATITGVLYAIPYLGAVVSTLLIGLVALQGATLYKALVVLCIMIFIHQFLFDQIIAPRIIGKQVGLHPLWAITAMLIGGTLMGVGGTLIAIPLAAGAQVVLMHLYPRLGDNSVALLSETYMRESEAKAKVEKETGEPPRPRRTRGLRDKRITDSEEVAASGPAGNPEG
jgi:predicted PurR-regulated permease PerM